MTSQGAAAAVRSSIAEAHTSVHESGAVHPSVFAGCLEKIIKAG